MSKWHASQPPFKESKVSWQWLGSYVFHFSGSALWCIIIDFCTTSPNKIHICRGQSYGNNQRVNLSLTNLTGFLVLLTQVMFHGEYSLSAKAWNGRVICSWLSETMPIAARGFPAGHDEGRVSLVCHALNLIGNMWLFPKFWGCDQHNIFTKQCYHLQISKHMFFVPWRLSSPMDSIRGHCISEEVLISILLALRIQSKRTDPCSGEVDPYIYFDDHLGLFWIFPGSYKCLFRISNKTRTEDAAQKIYEEGRGFIRAFKTLGYISIRLKKPTFLMKPKVHVSQSGFHQSCFDNILKDFQWVTK